MSTKYTNLSEISNLQTNIMRFIDNWARVEKTPIPLKAIVLEMENQGIHNFTTIKAIQVLLCKGYIRKAIMMGGNDKRCFVQLRGLL